MWEKVARKCAGSPKCKHRFPLGLLTKIRVRESIELAKLALDKRGLLKKRRRLSASLVNLFAKLLWRACLFMLMQLD